MKKKLFRVTTTKEESYFVLAVSFDAAAERLLEEINRVNWPIPIVSEVSLFAEQPTDLLCPDGSIII